MTTFVPLVGQYDNLGDVFLRRRLAAWIDDDLHVLLAGAPNDFVAALDLPSSATVYRSFARWSGAMATDSTRARYVYKPGEIQMSLPGMKEHVGLLPLVARLRASGGRVGRVGVGTRSVAQPYVSLCRPSVVLSDVTFWRDDATRAAFGRGQVAPDLAFAEGSDASTWDGEDRSLVVVSLRGDLPIPSDSWFEAIRRFADRKELDIVCVSQVRRDDRRTLDCADFLGGRAVCLEGITFGDAEQHLRHLYRRTCLAVSDRLHVLVGAATEGAAVSAALDRGSPKIRRHFDVIGLGGVEVTTGTLASDDRVRVLETAARSVTETRAGVERARTELRVARAVFAAALGYSA